MPRRTTIDVRVPLRTRQGAPLREHRQRVDVELPAYAEGTAEIGLTLNAYGRTYPLTLALPLEAALPHRGTTVYRHAPVTVQPRRVVESDVRYGADGEISSIAKEVYEP